MEYKICTKCGEIKSLDLFVNRKTGKASYCKVCNNKQIKEKNLERRNGTYVNPKDLSQRAKKFAEDGTKLHGGIYIYDKSIYKSYHEKLEIFCSKHQGYFWQTPGSHLSGNGCNICYEKEIPTVGLKRRLTQEKALEKAEESHPGKFLYSNFKYVHSLQHVSVTCPAHGDFSVMPHNLFAGYGCPRCKSSGYNSEKPGNLYLLKCGDITKIGITNREVQKRLKEVNKSYGQEFHEIFSHFDDDGAIPLAVEYSMKQYLVSTYNQPNDKFDGYTECFLGVDDHKLIGMIQQSILNIKRYYGVS